MASEQTEDPQLLIDGQKLYENYDPEEDSLKKQDDDGGDKYNVFTEFLKQLNPGVEMYRLAVPVFLLQNTSFLEKLSIYSSPTSLMQRYVSAARCGALKLLFLVWLTNLFLV